MPLNFFDLTTADYMERRSGFRGKDKSEFYEGDLLRFPESEVDVKIAKRPAGKYRIYKTTSHSGFSYFRSTSHIRTDNIDMTVILFVKKGRMIITYPGRHYEIGTGECAITHSLKAYHLTFKPDPGGIVEVLNITVKGPKFCSKLTTDLEIGRPLSTAKGKMFLAERILTMLFEEDATVDAEDAERMIETVLDNVVCAIGEIAGPPQRPLTISDQRVMDIKRYIDENFNNANLNTKIVAENCGISIRYLCYILKRAELSFSQLLWDRRMAVAEAWLADERMRHNPISLIAFSAGFKSSAHFSRMFKTRNKISPIEYRKKRA